MTIATPKVKKTIGQRFAEFHAAHPFVYDWIRYYADHARQKGFSRYSAHLLIHIIRWSINMQHGPGKTFGINDQFASRYARLLMHNEPGAFAGFFELRKIKTP
jgi:hypothetical protein